MLLLQEVRRGRSTSAKGSQGQSAYGALEYAQKGLFFFFSERERVPKHMCQVGFAGSVGWGAVLKSAEEPLSWLNRWA